MKTFQNLIKMDQSTMKTYLHQCLKSAGYEVISGDGYLFAKGDIPVMVTAHMDTVHRETVKVLDKIPILKGSEFTYKLSSPQGIGGDDRCGIWMILEIIKETKPTILFCEDEEKGCIGSTKFCKTSLAKGIDYINYIIELDRRGSNDAVFYSCDNPDFTEWIEENSGYVKANGTCSDISEIMPTLGVAGVNFSCGYYNEHTIQEYVMWQEVLDTKDMVLDLLSLDSEKFEYIEKKYKNYGGYYNSYYNSDWYGEHDYDYGVYGRYSSSSNTSNTRQIDKDYDTKVTLEVYLDETYQNILGVESLTSKGSTKPECWMNLFMENPYLAFDGIEDYVYM